METFYSDSDLEAYYSDSDLVLDLKYTSYLLFRNTFKLAFPIFY